MWTQVLPTKNQIDGKSLYRQEIGQFTIWFSYETPIGIKGDNCLYINDTKYSTTSSRHRNIVLAEYPNTEIRSISEGGIINQVKWLYANYLSGDVMPKGEFF